MRNCKIPEITYPKLKLIIFLNSISEIKIASFRYERYKIIYYYLAFQSCSTELQHSVLFSIKTLPMSGGGGGNVYPIALLPVEDLH